METVGALLAGAIICCLLLGARLAVGPISLNFMNSMIASSLNMPDHGVFFSVDQTELAWDGEHNSVVLRALYLRAYDKDRQALATLPDLSIGVSLHALLLGKIAPSRIALIEPSLNVIRYPDGHFGFETKANPEEQGAQSVANTDILVKELLDALRSKEQNRSSLGYLRRLEIRNADVVFDDQKNGTTWWIPKTNLFLNRTRQGLFGEAEVQLELNEQITKIRAGFSWPSDSADMVLTSRFDNIDLTNVALLVPELRDFSVLQLPVSGALRFVGNADGQIREIGLTATGGEGFLARPDMFADKVPVRSLNLDIDYLNDNSLVLKKFQGEFGEVAIEVTGRIEKKDDQYAIGIKAGLKNLDMANLEKYWPLTVALNAREWVVPNIREGHVPAASAEFSGVSGKSDLSDLKIEKLAGSIDFNNITVDYFNPLPKAKGINGRATFDADNFNIEGQGGDVEGIKIGATQVVIHGLTAVDQDIDIKTQASGPLTKALEIVDSDPLHLPSKRDIKPVDIRGQFAADLRFQFPLLKDLQLEQLKIDVNGDMKNVYHRNAFRGFPLSRGDLKIKLTQSDMEIAGQAYLGGFANSLLWYEDFRDHPEKYRSHYLVKADVPDIAADIFDIPQPIPISGNIEMDLDYSVYTKQDSRLTMQADLQNASVAVPELNWWKEIGVPANGRVDIVFVNDNIKEMPSFHIKSKESAIEGRAEFQGDGELSRLELPVVRTPNNDARVAMQLQKPNTYSLSVSGKKIDIAHLYGARATPDAADAGGKKPPKTTYLIDATLGELSFGGKSNLHNVDAHVALTGSDFDSLRLNAETVGAENARTPIEATIIPSPQGRKVVLQSNDAGEALRALDMYDTMYGGRLILDGTYLDATKGKPLVGKINIFDFRVKDAPVLAQLLNLSSLTGILDNLSGQGIGFEKMIADIRLVDQILTLKDGRISGSSIGLNFDGTIDLNRRLFDLAGILIPANAINKMISGIPVIGSILTAGGDQPLLAFNYKIRGGLAAPRVSVNPLSALTPGVLRQIFGSNKK